MAKNGNYILIAVLVTLASKSLCAQDTLHSTTKPIFITGAALYDFPQSFGAIAGIDYPLAGRTKQVVKKNGQTKIRNRDFIITSDIGFYRYTFNHTGVFLNAYVGTRHLYNNGSYFEKLIGAGALYTIYDGLTYSVNANGTVKQKNTYGRLYATMNFALAYGWDLSKLAKPKPFSLEIKPILSCQFPYNSFILLHGSLALGVKYNIAQKSVRLKEKHVVKIAHS